MLTRAREKYDIVTQVEHGIPLEGECDYCPHRSAKSRLKVR